MLSETSVVDLYHLLQQDPLHVDLSAYPTALTDSQNVDCLITHLINFGAVETLNLAGVKVSAEVLEDLIRSVEAGGLTYLTYLNLRNVQPSVTQVEHLLRALKARAPLLTTLDIGENSLGDTVVTSLSGWLPPTLQSLDVGFNSLSPAAVTHLLRSLASADLGALERLELSDNQFDVKSCEALKALLTTTECQTTLKELLVAHCALNEANSSCLAEAVHASAIEVLDLSRNNCLLSFIFAVDEGSSVAFPTSLRALDFSGNACQRGAVGGLVESLQGSSDHIEELYLRQTFRGDSALQAFLCGIGSMPALRVLDLENCGLTYRSGKVLAQQLPMHSQLAVLRLSHNMLEVEGVMDMASGLERLCRLMSLELGSCNLGNCGAVAVVTSLLRSGAPIKQLDISDNAINNAGLRDVCTLLSRLTCPRLQRLIISRNPYTKESQTNLLEMIQSRQSTCQVVAEDTPLDEVASQSLSVVSFSASSSPLGC